MPQQRTATLATIFSEILADLAFMFSDEAEPDSVLGQEWLETEISYKGPSNGKLSLWCSRDFSTLLAGNLLGIEPGQEGSEEASADAVKEFMNIICGQFVTAVHGIDDVFDLSIPSIRELYEEPNWDENTGDDSVRLTVSGERVQLRYERG